MDLYSGLPYWIAKNRFDDYYNPLRSNYVVDVLIIGSGITGALVAHELCAAGLECAMIDRRSIASGSTTASTALLQYEIDTPLCRLAGMMPEEDAAQAYKASLKAISDLKAVYEKIGLPGNYEQVPNIYYASNKKDGRMLEQEFEIRRRHGLPVELISAVELEGKWGIKAPLALRNDTSAQTDPYLAATSIISHYMDEGVLDVFTHTTIQKIQPGKEHCELRTAEGNRIRANYVVVAAGYEAGKFLRKDVMKLTSTYAFISEPIDPALVWYGKSLIWETAHPYLYIRTDSTNRIIVGGEDEEFRDPVKRDALLRKKTETLRRKFNRLFPHIDIKPDMAWCGTFSETRDGLPFIGPQKKDGRVLFALGYGGNGITFSLIAAQVIRNILTGVDDDRLRIFGFGRNCSRK